MKPTLLILAAGMGSRYGGLKQIDPIGPEGEAIIEYSIYDAIRAGFGKVVFVIRKTFEEAFKEKFSNKFEDKIEVKYAFQEVNTPIPGVEDLPERTKPWGTAHAVLVAHDQIQEPFAVINADDYYGVSAFEQIAEFLTKEAAPDYAGMVGYILKNTITDNGSVNRGVCQLDDKRHLTDVVERHKIKRGDDGMVTYTESDGETGELTDDTIVSMNFWGFHPSIFKEINQQFIDFAKANKENPKAEFYIPLVADTMIKAGKMQLKVLTSQDQWYGVTYREDKDMVVDAFKNLTVTGVYPSPLW